MTAVQDKPVVTDDGEPTVETPIPPLDAADVEKYGRFSLKRITGGAPTFPLLILFGLNAVDELDRQAYNTLLPEIRKDFGLDLQGIGTLNAVIGLFAILLALGIGFYADRGKRTRIAAVGAAVWAVFSLLTGLAPGLILLGAARVGAALGKAVNEPTHNSLLPDYYDIGTRAKVFAFHRSANNIGQFTAPIIAGGLVGYLGFSWRAAFVLFALPTAILVFFALRLREPVRGALERRAMGADDETANTEEEPTNFSESWRTLMAVRSLRRFYLSLPFFFASLSGLGQFLSLYYDEVFGLGAGQRGLVLAFDEPFAVIGLIVGAPLLQRALNKRPAAGMRVIAAAGAAIAVLLAVQAIAPTLWIAIPASYTRAALGAILIPGIYAVLAMCIPSKSRALGFAAGGIFGLLGLILLPFIGAVGDAFGIRYGILMLLPVYLTGSAILYSCAKFIDSDIAKVRASSLTQAESRKARLDGDPKILLVRGLDVSYGQTQVLFGVDFHVDEGEIVALLGTNGAGKSTLLNAISGIASPSAGAIVYDGIDISMADPNTTVAKGIVFVPGGKGVFPTLTVAENMNLAGWLFHKDPEYLKRATEEALDYFPVLRERWDQKAGNLSGGEQQMLTLSQAFIAKPKLLMIDELSLGLAPVIVEQLLGIVRAIHENGTTIILVEQSVNVAMTLAKRAVFMEKGEVRFDGPTSELLARPDVLRAVFLQGTKGAAAAGAGAAPVEVRGRAYQPHCESCGSDRHEIVRTRDLSVAFGGIRAVSDVDLMVREGEILGIIGPNGAGKTTLFDLISGFLVPTGGTIELAGEDVTSKTPDQRALLGLGRSFQDARLFPALTVREAIATALERHIKVKDAIATAVMSPASKASERWVSEEVDRLVELLHLEAFADKFISELSTGSRRVVDLACCVAHDPKVLLLDEPSSGIAQRETEALAPLLLELRDRTGTAMVVIEHDMPLIQGISDRMVALELGRVLTEGTPQEVVNDPRVVSSYLGGSEVVINRSGTVSVEHAEAAPPRRRRRGPAANKTNGSNA
jgi:ABC-type branched-subunit amino acid transport system ATPase component/MFS family permease